MPSVPAKLHPRSHVAATPIAPPAVAGVQVSNALNDALGLGVGLLLDLQCQLQLLVLSTLFPQGGLELLYLLCQLLGW